MLNKTVRLVSFLDAMFTYKTKLANFFRVSKKEIERYYSEINTSEFLLDIHGKVGNYRNVYLFGMLNPLRAPLFYVICRIIKPEIIVETGVADGFSSSCILYALKQNKQGRLYSIDLPNQPGQEITHGRPTGWLVPAEFKERWTLILGSSREKLPSLLNDLKKVDVFYHDSDHSYENMMFEFKEAEKYLASSKVLISDDVSDTLAFRDFTAARRNRCLVLFKTGIVKL